MSHPESRIQDQFLTPSPNDREIVVLTDKSESAAIFASERATTALSAEAIRILRMSFMAETPIKLPAIVRGRVSDDFDFAAAWLDETVEQGLFHLSTIQPEIQARPPVSVRAGDIIEGSDFGRGRGVAVEHDGRVDTRVVGSSTVHWYTADVEISENSQMLGLRHPAAVTVPAPVSARMQISRMPGGVGANCNVCGACGTCGACGGCVLCGELDFAVGVIATVAVDAGLALTNAASTFERLRTQG